MDKKTPITGKRFGENALEAVLEVSRAGRLREEFAGDRIHFVRGVQRVDRRAGLRVNYWRKSEALPAGAFPHTL